MFLNFDGKQGVFCSYGKHGGVLGGLFNDILMSMATKK